MERPVDVWYEVNRDNPQRETNTIKPKPTFELSTGTDSSYLADNISTQNHNSLDRIFIVHYCCIYININQYIVFLYDVWCSLFEILKNVSLGFKTRQNHPLPTTSIQESLPFDNDHLLMVILESYHSKLVQHAAAKK